MSGRSEVFADVPEEVAFLAPYVAAGVVGSAEIHLAATIARLGVVPPTPFTPSATSPESEAGWSDDQLVLLAVAVAARAPRSGHVCVDLDRVHRMVGDPRVGDGRSGPSVADLWWPDAVRWGSALASSSLVSAPSDAATSPIRPIVWDGRRLYLQRLWVDEQRVAEQLLRRAGDAASGAVGVTDPSEAERAMALEVALDRTFGPDPDGTDLQRAAGRRALDGQLAVVVGGPGTGKTRTVARLLAAALSVEPSPNGPPNGPPGRPGGLQVALAAPTGKAAARMTAAVHAALGELDAEGKVDEPVLERLRTVQAVTLHRLLGRSRDGGFRHDVRSPLPHDLVVVDETSMVDLPLMARLLGALNPSARLVLVGDPDQLASVEAGTVLADVTAGAAIGSRVVRLTEVHRFDAGSGIAALAEAIRGGDAEAALSLLADHGGDVSWVRPGDPLTMRALESEVVDAAAEASGAAVRGDADTALALARSLKVLAAMRHRSLGLYDWSQRIQDGVNAALPGHVAGRSWYPGRPVMVTANDALLGVANGDTGVVLSEGGRLVVALDTGGVTTRVPAVRLDRVETWWAMTIHKSQGSEFDRVVVSLPTEDSPVLTRELLYTAVTRARRSVVVVADEATIRRAIERPVSRASGLSGRLG